jgi:hypothetical protein
LKFLILGYALHRLPEFLEIAERLAASGIQPAPHRFGDLALETSKRRQIIGLIPASTRRNW